MTTDANPAIAAVTDVVKAAGDPSSVLLRTVVIGAEASTRLPEVVAAVGTGSGRVLVLADPVPFSRAGASDVKASLARLVGGELVTVGAAGHAVGQRVHADEATVADVVARTSGADVLVTIGSGTMVDLGKVAAAAHGIPHVVVQSAASVNGFTDDQSVLLRDGAKRTTPSRWPSALLADTTLIREAPVSLNAAGVGDLLAMFVGPADWLLASSLGIGPGYRADMVDLVRPHGARLLDLAHGLEAGDLADVEDLTRLLALSGLTMGLSGCTAPSSGTEHAIAHLLEMRLGEDAAWHGLQVGVATIAASRLWERVRDHLREHGPGSRLPDVDATRERVLTAFGPLDPSGATAAECWAGYARKLTWLAANQDRLGDLLSRWDRLDQLLDPLLATASHLADGLRGSAVPLRFTDLGAAYDRPTVAWAVGHGHLMRDRFTVADLADLLGIWSTTDVETMLDELAADGLVT